MGLVGGPFPVLLKEITMQGDAKFLTVAFAAVVVGLFMIRVVFIGQEISNGWR